MFYHIIILPYIYFNLTKVKQNVYFILWDSENKKILLENNSLPTFEVNSNKLVSELVRERLPEIFENTDGITLHHMHMDLQYKLCIYKYASFIHTCLTIKGWEKIIKTHTYIPFTCVTKKSS